MQFCGKFEDGQDSSYEIPSKKEIQNDEISQAIKALLRLYEGSIKALLRLYQGSIKALLRLY